MIKLINFIGITSTMKPKPTVYTCINNATSIIIIDSTM